MSTLQFGDPFGAYQRGAAVGKSNRLNQLMGQAQGTTQEQQRGLVQSAMYTDAAGGRQMQQTLDSDRDAGTKRLAQKAGMVAKIYRANPQMAAGMYGGLVQEASGLFPDMQLEPNLDDATAGLLEQFSSAYAVGGEGDDLKSLRIGANGNYWAIRGGQFVDTGTAAAPTHKIMDTGNGVVGIDNRTLGASPVTMGGQPPQGAPQMGQQRAPGEVPFSVDPSLPPEVQAAIRANEPQWAQASDQSQMQIPQQGQPQGGQLRTTPKPRAAPTGYRENPDGSLAMIPGGPAENAHAARADAAAARKAAEDIKASNKQRETDARLSASRESADALISAIDDLTEHAGFNDLGTMSGDLKIGVPGIRNAAKDADAKLKNIAGQVALATLSKLKTLSSAGATGFGALSAPELTLVQNSIATLQSENISNAEIRRSLKVIRDTMEKTTQWQPPQQTSGGQNRPAPDNDDDALIGKYL